MSYISSSVHVLCACQSCLTCCKLMDCSQPGSSVYGIFQARILELVVISFSRGLLSIIIPISLKLDMNSGQVSYSETSLALVSMFRLSCCLFISIIYVIKQKQINRDFHSKSSYLRHLERAIYSYFN